MCVLEGESEGRGKKSWKTVREESRSGIKIQLNRMTCVFLRPFGKEREKKTDEARLSSIV
jgi:hypothetical protein